MAVGDGSSLGDVVAGALPGILDRARVIISPYPFGVGADDNLRIVSFNAAPGVVIEIHGRLVAGGAEAAPFRFVHQPNTNRSVKTEDFKLGPGIVTNLSVFVASGAPVVNQCWVVVQLIKSLGAVAYVMGTLASGPVTPSQSIGWPGSPIVNSVDGAGYARVVQGTMPAAGVAIEETVPVGATWELFAVNAQFTTSAAAGNRSPFLTVKSGGVSVIALYSPGNVPPSTSRACSWAQGLACAVDFAAKDLYQGLPLAMQLKAGDKFSIDVDGLNAADQWAAPLYSFREYLDP